jgi:hypothetical protein
MDNLRAIKILQPTDIISGDRVLLSIQIDDSIDLVTKIVYSLYATVSGETQTWHTLATVNYPLPGSDLSVFSTTFNSLLFMSPQDVHLKV